MNEPQHRSRRPVWFLAVIILEWVIVAWLGLEFIEAGRAFIAERAYREYFEAQNRKVYRMVPAEELDAPENKFVPAAVTGAGGTRPETTPKSEALSFPEDEQSEATIRGEMHAIFNASGELLKSYGEPLVEQDLKRYLSGGPFHGSWDLVLQSIRSGESGLKTHFSLTWTTPVHYDVTLSKTEEGRYELVARDVNNSMPLEALHYGEVPGPESPWEVMFYRYKKNWSQEGNSLLQTNEFGFRDHPVTMPKPDGLYRIVCIGGSTTEEGNSTDATYPKILQRKLTERFGAGKVEVINAGTCGSNSYNMRRRFADFLAMEPDLILYYGGVNDTTHVHFQFWLQAVSEWKRWARQSFLLKRYFGYYLLPDEEELAAYMRDTTYRNLLAMRHEARKHGVEMAWCSFAYPTLRWHDFRAKNYYDVNMRDVWDGKGLINFKAYCKVTDLFNATGKAIAEKENIPWFPIAESFNAGPDHFFDICHMTPLGMELKTNIFSGLVAAFLENRGLI